MTSNKFLLILAAIVAIMMCTSRYTEARLHKRGVYKARMIANAQVLSYRNKRLKRSKLPLPEYVYAELRDIINGR